MENEKIIATKPMLVAGVGAAVGLKLMIMREIKFRVWEQNIKLMAYPSDKLEMSGDEGFSHLSQGFDIDDRHITLASQGWDVEHEGKLPCIIMQYVGIEDGSGKEIYEGDIIEERYEGDQVFLGVVKFKNGEFFIDGRGANIIYSSSRNLTISIKDKRVIGNIYENPGLLAAAPPCP